jgi:bifunctional DNA-binding transcriptional regulator/antitoxin component of YhaV-PrlF toxin-antitoxin module
MFIPGTMILASLDADGRLILPKEVLKALGLSPGDQVGFSLEGDQAVIFRDDPDEIEPVTGLTTREIRALLAETEGQETYPADEVFARLHAHIEEVARRSDAA